MELEYSIVCAWCKKLMKKGSPLQEEISHGICPKCEKKHFGTKEKQT